MRMQRWQVNYALGLIALSILFYLIHFWLFHDAHHIFIYLVGDIAFLPLEVLIVSMVIHELLSNREKQAMFEKLNMIIGVFFSEAGRTLLAYFSDYDPKLASIRQELIVEHDWNDEDFDKVDRRLHGYDFTVNIDGKKLSDLKIFLSTQRDLLLRLLENPNLLEHEAFTELLRAVFHLTEELASRNSFDDLPADDISHLAIDVNRSYVLLVKEWFAYMRYLKKNYPFLYSLAMRTNPFDADASAIIST